jgi:hypothetical protein
MDLTMHNTPAPTRTATCAAFSDMNAYQLLQATKSLVASQHIAALTQTAAYRIDAPDRIALVDWAEAKAEAVSDELFELLSEFESRTDLDADGRAWRETAIALAHEIVPAAC